MYNFCPHCIRYKIVSHKLNINTEISFSLERIFQPKITKKSYGFKVRSSYSLPVSVQYS